MSERNRLHHEGAMVPCVHCGTPRDPSGVGTPCCVATMLEQRPKDALRLFVPAGGDPDKVRIWLGGHGSGFVYYDDNDESVVLGVPPGCHLEHRIAGPNTYSDFDPRTEGQWAVTLDGVTLATGRLCWKVVPAR